MLRIFRGGFAISLLSVTRGGGQISPKIALRNMRTAHEVNFKCGASDYELRLNDGIRKCDGAIFESSHLEP
jgi:hypothetical protein